MTTDKFTMFGYPVRLVIDMPAGPDDVRQHDVTICLEIVTTDMAAPRSGFWVDPDCLLREIEIEKRARQRAAEEGGTQ